MIFRSCADKSKRIKSWRFTLLHDNYGDIKTNKSYYQSKFLSTYNEGRVSGIIGKKLSKFKIPFFLTMKEYKEAEEGDKITETSIRTFYNLPFKIKLDSETMLIKDFNDSKSHDTRINLNP